MSKENSFDEERVNKAFRRVRNRLRKHYSEEIILACIKKLNEQPQDRIQHLRMYPPLKLAVVATQVTYRTFFCFVSNYSNCSTR